MKTQSCSKERLQGCLSRDCIGITNFENIFIWHRVLNIIDDSLCFFKVSLCVLV